MTCRDCGEANFAWATRCDHCGASLEPADRIAAPAGVNEHGAIRVEQTAPRANDDPPEPRTTRPIAVTIALIVLNVAMFAVMTVNGGGWDPSIDELTRWGANHGPFTVNGQWWRLLTATALHGNVLHLLLNVFALWYAGRIAEPLFGRAAFLVLYLLSGLGGSVASLWWQPFATGVGASGAIFGIYGGIGSWLMVQHRSMPAQASAPLAGGLVAIVGYNLVFGLFQQNVDVAAHVGGLATGFVAGSLLAAPVAAGTVWIGARAALVAIAGVVTIGALAWRLPKVDDIRQVLTRVSEAERTVNSELERLAAELQQGQITPDTFARSVSDTVLPRWTAARVELAQMRAGPEQQTVAEVVSYMSVREDAIRLTAQAVTTGDASQMNAARQRRTEADALALTLTSRAKGARPSNGTARAVSLSGSVKDVAVPRGGARVLLRCASPPGRQVSRRYLQACGSGREMQTDAKGTFAFSEIVPGPYVVRVAMDGYASDERQIDLTEDTSFVVGLRPAVDLNGLITAVQALEAETLRRFNMAVADARAGRITGDEFSRIVKKELLPPWERRRAELAELKLTPDQHRVTASVISYMQLRGESWGLLADGVRTKNTALIKLGQQKHDAAMAAAKKMGEDLKPTHGRGNTDPMRSPPK